MVGTKDKVGVFGHGYGEEVEENVHDTRGQEAIDNKGALGNPSAVPSVGGGWERRYISWCSAWDWVFRRNCRTGNGGNRVVPT